MAMLMGWRTCHRVSLPFALILPAMVLLLLLILPPLVLLLLLLLLIMGFDTEALTEVGTETGRDVVALRCEEYAAPFNSASRQCANSKSLPQAGGGAAFATACNAEDKAA